MSIANVKNVNRYFKEITPEIAASIEQEPKEPDPALLLAQAEMEKRRTEMTKAIADKAQEDKKLRMDDDFRRDQLNVQSILKAAELEGKFLIDVNEQELEAMNIANEANQPEAE